MQFNWYLQHRIVSVVTTVRTHSIGIEKDYQLEICNYVISFECCLMCICFILCVFVVSHVYLLYLMCICCTIYALLFLL
jgi:hypothetical protein